MKYHTFYFFIGLAINIYGGVSGHDAIFLNGSLIMHTCLLWAVIEKKKNK